MPVVVKWYPFQTGFVRSVECIQARLVGTGANPGRLPVGRVQLLWDLLEKSGLCERLSASTKDLIGDVIRVVGIISAIIAACVPNVYPHTPPLPPAPLRLPAVYRHAPP